MGITVDKWVLSIGLALIIPGFLILWIYVSPACAIGALFIGVGSSVRRT